MGTDKGADLRIRIGLRIHHVAPVTPDCFQIEQDKAVFPLGLLENQIRPGLPLNLCSVLSETLPGENKNAGQGQHKKSAHSSSFRGSALKVASDQRVQGKGSRAADENNHGREEKEKLVRRHKLVRITENRAQFIDIGG